MRFKDRIAAEQKAAQALVAKGEDNLTDEEFNELKGHYAEIKKLREQAELFKGATDELDSMAAASKPKAADKPARTMGEHFAKELKSAGLSVREAARNKFETSDFKAASDVQLTTDKGEDEVGYQPYLEQIDTAVFENQRQLVVADLFSQGSIEGNTLKYPVYGKLEGAPAATAEGASTPHTHFPAPEWELDTLHKVGVMWDESEEMIEDLPYIASEINSQNDYAMGLTEEDQLLSGDGLGENIKGLMTRIPEGSKIAATDERTVADRIFHAKTMINVATGHTADALVISPLDYEALRLAKDANEQYYGGGFFLPAYGGTGQLVIQHTPWGLRTVVTPALEDGTCIVGAFKAGGKVFRKGGRRLQTTQSDQDKFGKGLTTFRLTERIGLQVKYPYDFVEVSTEVESGSTGSTGTTGETGETGDTGATGQSVQAAAAKSARSK